MWLSERRSILAGLLALPLSACGFSPVYAPGGAGTTLRGQIEFAAPEDRFGFELVSQLEERLSRGGSTYALDYQISVSSQGIAITGTNDTTRVRLNGSVRYRLTETATGAVSLSGEVESFTTYSTTLATLATDAAERDAETRLMVILADLVADDLIAGAARVT